MTEDDVELIRAWLLERGLAGAAETELVQGFCQRCLDSGLRLSRSGVIVDTLHPVYEGRIFRWRGDGVEQDVMLEYGRTTEGEAAENWRRSVFFHMLETGMGEFRRNLVVDGAGEFPNLRIANDEGVVDYAAFIHRFAREGSIGDMDCIYSYWGTHDARGFEARQFAALRRLLPALALAIKCASLTRIASTIAEVYLGHDAAERVLSGRITRGVAERLNAVLWFSDLRGYTAITDTAPPDSIIPLLNDYSAAVIAAIHAAGGNVLKLIGDGVLATFRAEDREQACRCALDAAADLRGRQASINERREAAGQAVTSIYLGLHIGEVLFGNIGSEDRLDFTVVGPAVNEVSRIASMCRSVDRGVVTSAAFAAAVSREKRRHLVSLGRYALKGFGRAQELFTLEFDGAGDPELVGTLGD